MAYEFILPDLGEGITEAEIRKWLVKEGDMVEEHQSVVEVETDKAVVEVPSPRKGHVRKILRGEGEIVNVGEPLMSIVEEGEVREERRESVSVVGVLPEAEEEPKESVLATPAVRALAREKGISLEGIRGTGPRGSITREDLLAALGKVAEAAEAADEFGPVERLPMRGVRRTIARNLLKAHQMTVCVTGMEEVDVTELWEMRKREDKEVTARGVHLTYFPFIVKAVQHALMEHPMLNASVDEEGETIIRKKYYNIGFAVDTPDGLIVPVLRNVERKSIIELAAELQDMAERARQRTITLQELKGSTFTITNYGQFGGGFSTPILNYPDVAILGCGRIADRPWVVDGTIVIRKILPISLTFDHRVTDGGDATRFLSKTARYLEDPALLFIESK
ncbi:MAG TPA: dihydrolipoamide acetyltransferase family protein [Geobacteraceae bacterium]|nr:dihydrolipoamide acetyltransferase family protein [Geobacteraceae bacterium]